MSRFFSLTLAILLTACQMTAQGPSRAHPTTFNVRQVSEGSVFIDGGKNEGLAPGMTLTIRRKTVFAASYGGEVKATMIVATLRVVSVSNSSAMCEVRTRNIAIIRGDIARVTEENQPAPLWTAGPPRLNQPVGAIPDTTEPTTAVPAHRSLAERARDALAANGQGRAASASAPADPPTTPVNRSPVVTAANSNTTPVVKAAPPSKATASAPGTDTAPTATAPASARPTPVTEIAGTAAANASDPTNAKPAASAPVVVQTAPAMATVVTPPPSPIVAAAAVSRRNASTASTTPAVASTATPSEVITPSAPASPAEPAKPATTARSTEVAVAAPAPVEPQPATSPAARPATLEPAVITGAAAGVPLKTTFKVKYVAEDAVYIDAGKNAGLEEGMTLSVVHGQIQPGTSVEGSPQVNEVVAEVAVVSVSNSSAVCEIRSKNSEIQRGDVAVLSQADQQRLEQLRVLSPNRKYPQVIAFSEGDPLDEEVRESVPKPPSPEVNRARGRIGVDYSAIRSSGLATSSSTQIGGVARMDMSRIGGTYWNLNGYWRGRMNVRSTSNQPQSVYDLVNRTYTMGLTYVNPGSHWTAGVGRLFLPWATSLDTTDGGYIARRFGKHVYVGAFGGTAPDPTSFDYNPDRRTAGTFVAFEGGSFEHVRFTSAEGVAVSAIEWRADRQFVFSENGFFYKRVLSIYNSMQADSQRLPLGGRVEGLSRSFSTLRIQPFTRLSFDVNHNYFRDVPTFDPLLVGTGLLDKFLFQGLSVGSRLDLPGRISVYDNFGQSNKSGDPRTSFNQLYGLTLGRIWKTGIRADARYSKFSSSFGEGTYRALSVSRSFSEMLRIEVNGGKQQFISSLGVPTDYRLLGSTVDLNLGRSYFIESGFNLQQGSQQNFEQWLMTLGYRFDSGRRK